MELNFGFGEKTLAPNPQLFAGVLEFVKEVLKGISMDIVFTPLFLTTSMKVKPSILIQKFSKRKNLGFFGSHSLARRRGQWSDKNDERAWKMWLEKVMSQSRLQEKVSSLFSVARCSK
jgi:hypothetical protein